ncbi:hypothetical protein GCM10010483_64340 [Actinokineospora diospyrosa]
MIQARILESGRTQREVAEAGEIDHATLSRFLNGTRKLPDGDLSVLAWAVGITSRAQRRALVELNRDHDKTTWWINTTTTPFAEAIDTVIRDHTRALALFSPHAIPAELTQPRPHTPTTGQYYIGRSALDRLDPSDPTTQDRLQRLLQLTGSSRIGIRVTSPMVFPHSFQVLTLDTGHTVVKVEILDRALYLEDAEDITRFRRAIDMIDHHSANHAATVAILERVAKPKTGNRITA